jgi:hypothetical protein
MLKRPKKRKCIFNEQLQKECPFTTIAKTSVSDTHVRCNTSALSSSISGSGLGDIKTRLNSNRRVKFLQLYLASH